MRNAFKWIGIAVLTPFLLFMILAVLIYLPPVQNWAVRQVAGIVAEKTGMSITVGHVNLEFPLDLGIEGFRAVRQNDSLPGVRDTIADVQKLTVDVRLRPLLKKRIVIKQLSIDQAKVNTDGFISDVRVKGEVGRLRLWSKGIDLDEETVEVNGARLSDARIDIALSDTAATDTTTSATRWKIAADSLTIERTDVAVHLPDDTLDIGVYLGRAVARKADIDLYLNIYKVESLDWHDGRFTFDNRWAPPAEGIDYSHLALSGIRIGIDSISYTPEGTGAFIRQTAMREKSGLEITELRGAVRLDSAFSSVKLPGLTLRTTDSDIQAEADIDFSIADTTDPGLMKVRMNAQIGKQDLMLLMGDMPQKFVERYPNHPLTVKGIADGNLSRMTLAGLDISLPTALHAKIDGTIGNLTEPLRMEANLKVCAEGKDLNFVTAFFPDTSIQLPVGITLDGTLKADGTHYTADLTASEGEGSITARGTIGIALNAKGQLATAAMTYDADIEIERLDLRHFMPQDSLRLVTASVTAKGYGTDFLSTRSRMDAKAVVSQLQYGHWDLEDLEADIRLKDGRGQAIISGQDRLFDGIIAIDTELSAKRIKGNLSADLAHADLYRLRLVKDPLKVGFTGDLEIESDLGKNHKLSGLVGDIFIEDEKDTFRPERIGVLLNTTPDTTYLRAQSGDLIVKLDASGGYEHFFRQLTTLGDSVSAQMEEEVIDQPAIKRLLPTMKLHVESKRENPIANLLKTSDVEFRELLLDLTTSPAEGINGTSHIYSLSYDSTLIDTIRLNLTQKGERLTYQAQIRNNKKNPQFVFDALIDGHIHEHGALAGLRYYDKQNRLGIRIGATADMERSGLRIKLMPDRPTLAYKEFSLNSDNYILLGKDRKIQANVNLVSDDKTGVAVYSGQQDSTMLQDITVSLNRIDLGKLTSVIPYAPHITGMLEGDYHILQDRQKQLSIASDMAVADLTYEHSPIGNLSTEFVYLMKEDDTHAVEARIMLDEKEVGLLSGTYQHASQEGKKGLEEEEGYIDADFTMNHFPLSIANGFVPDQLIGIEGFGEGKLSVKGTASHSDIDGEVFVDSAYLVSIPYGIRMRMDSDPIRIIDSKLLLENYGLYAYNEEPLNMMGYIDFTDFGRMAVDLRMRAQNLLLINAKQEAKSVAFGKAFVNFFARMQGPLDMMRMRGRLDVLSSTDMTYILLDSPLSADNRLNELVKFTDFEDSTQTVITRPAPEGLDVDLNISVSRGAHIVCDLNAEQTNYVDLLGGGDLRLKYNNEGINLTGRYTLSNGEMKYSLPVIPLKTFSIKDGSYVEFTGDPTNPKLNITATEQVKATVGGDEEQQSRSVLFECGVIITKTLNDMGLEFTIDAPEDNTINGELTSMSADERGKLAVGMLTTGMYLAGGTGTFSMNSALSSFLQSEINNIAGSALKTLDLSVDVGNSTDATGNTRTDYSFKFSKRFFDNRLKIQIGGKVSSGESSYAGEKQSFFDNVSMEYRLNRDATQYVKLFYSQNVYDWLDGYTSEYGGGFIWRRKLSNFLDIFRIWKKEEQPIPRQRQIQMPAMPTARRDSVTTDSVTTKQNDQ